ncbi:MAG: hypothetical protein NC401_18200 [Ruminococcus sp.]|nr:hypothetical protein [Ruminococcus sp.]
MENNNEMLAEQEVLGAPQAQSEGDPVAVSEGYRMGDGTRSGEISELYAQLEALKRDLVTAKVQTALLLLGVAKEKLEDGTTLAVGLCGTGKAPEEAAAEIVSAYPHLKAVQRKIPQFSAESAGSDDGFSAIRKIFSGR